MEECFGDRRVFWLARSDWWILLAGAAFGAVLILFV